MSSDTSPVDDRGILATAQRLREDVVQQIKFLGSVGGWEIVKRAAELLEWQHAYIRKIEDLVLAFDLAGLQAQPHSGEPALDRRNDCMWAALQYAWNREDRRKTSETVKLRRSRDG